ncbi:MAG: peptide chain release factor 2 [Spirochaetes bacterium]|nr:peptide chain release factor 2 [Spirochaetota bacterium]
MIIDYKQDIYELKNKCKEYISYINVDKLKQEIIKLEELAQKQDFWSNQKEANKIIKKTNDLKKRTLPWESFINEVDDLVTLYDLSVEEDASEYEEEISGTLEKLERKMEELEMIELLSDEKDKCNAIINIHPGAGGTEACDWAAMLYRMYTRWAESKNYKCEILDWLDGDEAGIKNVTFLIKGDFTYGYLKYESGIHRLVRISPFDSNARRHTSFASIYITPDVEDEIDFDINQADLRVDTYRASGAGGQHVNKTDSAVRITHIPTGIVVQCQNERSQHKNKTLAMKVLKARLYDHYRKEQEQDRERQSPEKKDIAWGSQIRSYIFQPYTMVKDHRTNVEVGNIQGVMDGHIDSFLDIELKMLSMKEKK